MTKAELEQILDSYIPGTGSEWREEILEVMEATYNRALEDAINLNFIIDEGSLYWRRVVEVRDLEKLKI